MNASRRRFVFVPVVVLVVMMVGLGRMAQTPKPADAVFGAYESKVNCRVPLPEQLDPYFAVYFDQHCIGGPLPIEEGLVVFRLESFNSDIECGGFVARWMDGSDDEVARFAFVPNGGPPVGYRALRAPSTDSYALRVLALGDWSARFTTYGPQGMPATYASPVQVRGTGNDVIGGIELQRGTATVTFETAGPVAPLASCPLFDGLVGRPTCAGDGNVIVRILDESGRRIARVADGCAPYSADPFTVSIPANGVYLLDIQSNAAWSVRVTQTPGELVD